MSPVPPIGSTSPAALSLRRRCRAGALAALALAGVAAASGGVALDLPKAHHTAEGFRNRYPHPEKASFWAWQAERAEKGLPKIPEGGWKFPVEKPDVAYLKANRTDTTATWIGHATVLLQVRGLNILTDPHLTERASPVSFAGPRRWVPPALNFDELPRIDIVVISHSHYDHLDYETVVRLAAQAGGSPVFYVGLGLAEWFRNQGIARVVEMDWWDAVEHGSARIHFVPVQHWSQRTLWDRNQTLWGAWVIETPSFRFFFAGDAGYSQDFRDIGRRFGSFDLAALPIGAYAPRWFMKTYHVDPDEAFQAHQDLHARQSMAVHWGTFVMSDEPLDEPPQRLAKALAQSNPGRFFVYRHGETRRFP